MQASWLNLLWVIALIGCGQDEGVLAPPAPTSESEPPRFTLRARVQLEQGGLRSQTEIVCTLTRVGRGRRAWRVDDVRERVTVSANGETRTERTRRPEFHTADPLEALGLPRALLRLTGLDAAAQPGREVRSLTLAVGGLRVPLRQTIVRSATGARVEARGHAALGASPIALHLDARARWERAPDLLLPRRLKASLESVARGGPGTDASSRVRLDLTVEPEVRS